MNVENVCGICGLDDETETHIFFTCEFSHVVLENDEGGGWAMDGKAFQCPKKMLH